MSDEQPDLLPEAKNRYDQGDANQAIALALIDIGWSLRKLTQHVGLIGRNGLPT